MVKEIYCRGGEIVLVDDEDFEQASVFSWIMSDGIALRYEKIASRQYEKKRLAHQIWCSMGRDPVASINYKNGDGTDCRRTNLCEELNRSYRNNVSVRLRNAAPLRNNLGFKGVSRSLSASNPFKSEIIASGNRKHLGSFPTPEAAARAYDAAAYAAWGTDCYLNFPEDYGLPPREKIGGAGSSLDTFLQEEGILDEVSERAARRERAA